MKTLLMRAWRFGAYGLALAAALATAWAVRERRTRRARAGGGAPVVEWSRPRTWRRARGWTNRTCSDGRFPRPGRPVPAWIRWRRKHCWARCCQRISMRARSSCRHICWANPPGRRRRRLRLALASRNARLECDRRRSRAVGWPAARGRQRRRLRILCPRRQAQRRSGAVWRRVLSVGAPADDGAPDTAGHAGGPPEDALRFVAARQGGILTAMLRHRDDAVAVGDEDQADPAALQGMPPNPLRRAALSSSTETGWTAGRRACGRRIRRRARGCDMALNRYRLAAMLGLWLPGGRSGADHPGGTGGGESRVLSHPGVRRVAIGNGQVLRAADADGQTCRGRGAARAHSVGPEHARRRQHRHRRRRSVRPGPRPHRRAGRAPSVSAGPHGTGLGPHGAAGRRSWEIPTSRLREVGLKRDGLTQGG